MKKKIINHALSIAKAENGGMCMDEKYIYIHDAHRIIRFGIEHKELFEGLEQDDCLYVCKKNFEFLEKSDYLRYELPTVKDIKANIKELVGNSRTAPVAYSGSGMTGINARYLAKVTENLNCRSVYVSHGNYAPYVFFLEDNCMECVAEMILPVNSAGKTGFWVPEPTFGIVTNDGTKKMTLKQICDTLGFAQDIVTPRNGAITCVKGTPVSVMRLVKKRCTELGYKMSRSLEKC